MDPATLIGIVGAFGFIIGSNIMEGGSPGALLNIPALILVFGGTMMISTACGTLPDAIGAVKGLIGALTGKAASSVDVVPVIVGLADKARKEGLLALEDQLKNIDDPFLVKGVTMAVDGTDPEDLREILDAEVSAKRAAEKHGAKFFENAGGFAPTVGIIGTVMGLVHVLENLSKPEELGHLIAGAFLATLWGVLTANVMWLPIANRMKRLSDLECARMEIVIEGVMAIQAGANPRTVQQKLRSLLPAKEQDQLEAAA